MISAQSTSKLHFYHFVLRANMQFDAVTGDGGHCCSLNCALIKANPIIITELTQKPKIRLNSISIAWFSESRGRQAPHLTRL